ncbi:uncharacterized protein Tco025E_00395 [Trypanosoma conorhini]|uniref:Uncharacterized protein n=1 Tax=Trypanosoma conorhini TaxID=83891 RepID=A0A422QBM8_9TRYP|nr:uncharacterized protein Tco025E_00395 [Trypanosoma conorhini]RNF27325.1 hypothetical protein Tco025E_00395 [Trypanosoma conorhini]
MGCAECGRCGHAPGSEGCAVLLLCCLPFLSPFLFLLANAEKASATTSVSGGAPEMRPQADGMLNSAANAHDASGDLAIAAGEKPGVAGKSNGHGAAEANVEAAVNLKNPHPSRNGAVHADPRQEAILPAPCAAVDENLRATPNKAPLRGGGGLGAAALLPHRFSRRAR